MPLTNKSANESIELSVLQSAKTQTGETLADLSQKAPLLIIFLRHCGCTFAREALADLSRQRTEIAAAGVNLVLVHMTDETDAASLFATYGLQDLPRISDPAQELYKAFDLRKGSAWQVLGPRMWWRGLKALMAGNSLGVPKGDIYQMPGVFLLRDGRIESAFRHEISSDRPNYSEIAAQARSSH